MATPFGRILLFLLLLGGSVATSYAGATIDPTFGVNGEAEVAGRFFTVQSDGKIVSADAMLNGSLYDLAIHRYTVNGGRDETFGAGGVVIDDVTTCSESPAALLVQPDGKILVAGRGGSCLPTPTSYFLVRYLPDGKVDLSFGVGGYVFFTNFRISTIEKLTIQSDGKIIAVGQGLSTFMMVRYTSGGVLDRSFGKEGVAITYYRVDCPICFGPAALTAVSMDIDGGILAGGWMAASTDLKYYIVSRFSSLGRLDFLRIYSSNQVDGATTFRTIQRLPNGKIIAIGDQVARFLSDGQLDPSFTQNRSLPISQGRGSGNGVLMPDGKIFQVGNYYTLPTSATFIRLFGANGGTIGQVNYYGANSYPATALIQPNGKLIVIADKMRRYLSISSLAAKQSDFDGDLISDIGYFRPGTGFWGIKFSTSLDQTTGGQISFGLAGDLVTPGHYVFNERPSQGKLRSTTSSIAVYRPSELTWYVSTPSGPATYQLTSPNELPVNGDFDGDGLDDLTGFENGMWRSTQSSDGGLLTAHWGTAGDLPVTGDYDYDGTTDRAVFRPSTGVWYVQRSSDGALQAQQFGLGTDRPVPGDYDDDGRTDLAVFRPSEGVWYISNSRDGSFRAVRFGLVTDRPAPGDYDGDGRTDLAVFRDGTWYIAQSLTNTLKVVQWGQAGDVPLSPGFTAN